MSVLIDFNMENIELEQLEEGIECIKLPELTDYEKKIIDPIVAPTSGLRIQLLDIQKEGVSSSLGSTNIEGKNMSLELYVKI